MINTNYYHGETYEFEHNGQKYSIDLKQMAKDLYDQHGTEKNDMEIYKVDENISLYFTNFHFKIENDEVNYCSLEGYVLLK